MSREERSATHPYGRALARPPPCHGLNEGRRQAPGAEEAVCKNFSCAVTSTEKCLQKVQECGKCLRKHRITEFYAQREDRITELFQEVL